VAVIPPTFMEVLDTSISEVILPHIDGSISATTDEATWVVLLILQTVDLLIELTNGCFIRRRATHHGFLITLS
jgi:MFS transporter, DHA2 family, multidrug resistance protein